METQHFEAKMRVNPPKKGRTYAQTCADSIVLLLKNKYKAQTWEIWPSGCKTVLNMCFSF